MWIGGDRDGNPYVTVETLEKSAQAQALKYSNITQLKSQLLYRDLSMSITMTNVSEEVKELAEASGEVSPHRTNEPYRRALTTIKDRLLATAYNLCENTEFLPPKRENASIIHINIQKNSQKIYKSQRILWQKIIAAFQLKENYLT